MTTEEPTMRRATDRKTPFREKLIGYLIAGTLVMTGISTTLSAANQIELNRVQHRMQEDQRNLEARRFQAELRACTLTQNGVKGERRLIQRAMNVSRRNGTLTREALNFYRVSLKDLKVPTCTPTDLGFPQFEPPVFKP